MDRVYNYYESNLRETNKVDFEENHSYDSRSDSDERTIDKQGKRRIIDQDSIPSSADETSTSGQSNALNESKQRRRLISRRDATSSKSEEECFDLASIASKENSNPSLIEPFHQDPTIQQKRSTSTTSNSIQERGGERTISTPTTTIMHQDSSEGESGTIILEQWKRSRMRRQVKKRNRSDDTRNGGTRHATHSTHPTSGNIPTSININQPHERKKKPISLTVLEKTTIKAQDAIGWDHFFRGRTANDFAPVIQQYYTNNKIRSFFTPLRWSNEINKYNFATHQSVWKKYCSEIASPIRSKNNISQRKLYLLPLVEKYYI